MADVLNWLWQGCLVAGAARLALAALGRSRARDRFLLCWSALVAILLLPLLTSLPAPAPSAPDRFDSPDTFVPPLVVSIAWWMTPLAIAFAAVWSSVQGLRLARAAWALRRLRRRTRPFPRSLESELCSWREASTKGRPARLVLSDDIRSAAVLGGRTPMIAVAPALLQLVGSNELDRIVIHEWAHVQRRDDLLNVVHLAARAIAGWHPAVWWLDRQLQIEREAACDEIAVAVTGSAKLYATSLANLAGLLPAREPLAALGALSSPGLSGRIARILAQRQLASPGRSIGASAGAIATLMIVALCVSAFPVVAASGPAIDAELRADRAALGSEADISVGSVGSVGPGRDHQRGLPARAQATTAGSPTMAAPITDARTPTAAAPAEAPGADPASDIPPADDAQVGAAASPLPGRTTAPLITSAPAAVAAASAEDDEPPVSPWDAAADAGVAVGHRSQQAAVATAGAFSRLGRRIAASF